MLHSATGVSRQPNVFNTTTRHRFSEGPSVSYSALHFSRESNVSQRALLVFMGAEDLCLHTRVFGPGCCSVVSAGRSSYAGFVPHRHVTISDLLLHLKVSTASEDASK